MLTTKMRIGFAVSILTVFSLLHGGASAGEKAHGAKNGDAKKGHVTTAEHTPEHPAGGSLFGDLKKAKSGHVKIGQSHAAWSYEGGTGPQKWGALKSDYKACAAGVQQSPIDLSGHVASLSRDLSLHWKPTNFSVVNNGHTIQANAQPGSYLTLAGKKYDLLQFHFHSSSEHTVSGRPYSMEAHFVHKSADGALAVVGVFMTPGSMHKELSKVWKGLPQTSGQTVSIAQPVDIAQLLPSNQALYRYEGSLTTPPCSEIVSWIVFRDPMQVAGSQIASFAKLYPANARPVQALHRRFVLGNF